MGDRKDGYLLRDLDGMHFIVPLIYPNRCDNEAFLSERIDLTNADAYLAKRNAENPEFQYTVFHLIVAAMIKTITLRPKMNRFIANKNMYQRNEVSASFVVKKQFSDEAQEGLAFVHEACIRQYRRVLSAGYSSVYGLRGSYASKDTASHHAVRPERLCAASD